MPGGVFYLDLLPRLSDLALSEAWEDKSYYAKRFPEFPFPALRFACIGGRLVDKDLFLYRGRTLIRLSEI